MFVFVPAIILCVSYVVLIKFVYYRHGQWWSRLKDKHSYTKSRAEKSEICKTRDGSSYLHNSKLGRSFCMNTETRALLVTAHPDDECMFFAPTILKLIQSQATVHLLCLTTGNYTHQGTQRKQELLDSCAVIGIPSSHVTIIDNKELPDDPRVQWSTALISSLIMKHIQNYHISLVLSFDNGGVSGHANHIAIYRSLRHLVAAGRIPKGCQVFSLHTINVLRKYLSVLELPHSWFLPWDMCCIIGWNEYKRAKEAMLCHRSQLLWFRRLYILFSSYMFVNTFQAISVETEDVKFY